MKSIKPGRGPSMMGAIGSIFAVIFGIFWMVTAASIGAGIMVPFGLVFIGLAVVSGIYNYRNATRKNRYSTFDITEDGEEIDPLAERFVKSEDIEFDAGSYDDDKRYKDERQSAFCPYCGTRLESGFEYCNICGKKIP